MPDVTIDLKLISPMEKIRDKVLQATGIEPVIHINQEKRIVFTADLTKQQALALRTYIRNLPPWHWDFDIEVS